MINYNKVAKVSSIKYGIIEHFNKNKVRYIVLGILLCLGLLTGIFTAIKLTNTSKSIALSNFSAVSYAKGTIYTFAMFAKRLLSAILVMAIIVIVSVSKYTRFISYLLLSYRAFLLTLNCTIIIISMGVGGVINTLLIILPCQLITLLLLSMFTIIANELFAYKDKCGYFDKQKFIKSLLISLILLLVINLIELLLLSIFKSSSILII